VGIPAFAVLEEGALNAPDIATKAAELVGGNRAESHGDMHTHFAHVASLWSAYLKLDIPLSAVDVPHMMALLKIARTKSGSTNIDDWIDGSGYLACAGEVATKEYRR
jgi:hypothetical protein